MSTQSTKPVNFDEVITALLDNSKVFPPQYLHRLSDLNTVELQKLKTVWPAIAEDRRVALFEDLEALAEADNLLYYDEICEFALDDSNPRVKQKAISMLWQVAKDKLIPKFITMMKKDPEATVRAAAAAGLGQFVYEGELEELDETRLHKVEDALFEVLNGSDEKIVRRRALEFLGFSSRKEVKPAIEKAYNSDDIDWLSSSLFAIGRSSDEVYIPLVMEVLDHPDSEVLFEAVRAAGELSAAPARSILVQMLQDGIEDDELRLAAIWSISQIGGEDVRETLDQLLEESEDEEETELIENAMDNLFLTEGMDRFNLLDFDLQGEDDLEDIVDLEQESGDEDIEKPEE